MNMPRITLHFRRNTGAARPRFSREDYITTSVVAFAVTLVALLGYDAYIFYQDIIERAANAPAAPARQKFSESDIDEIIMLLDERKEKFNEILLKNQ